MFYEKIHNKWNAEFQTEWDKIKWFSPSVAINRQKTIIYSFNDTSKKNQIQLSFSGDIDKYFSYRVSANNIKYDFPKTETFDNNYWFGNFDFSFSLSNNFSLTNGFRFNNYEWRTLIGYLGFFNNLRWEFRKNYFVYAGFKTAFDYYHSEKEPNYQKLYFKVTATF